MANVEKEEFKPLLAPGRHIRTMDELERICVVPFDTSATRSRLMGQLRRLSDRLVGRVGTFDLWVDGSFVTEKVNPEDIDLTIVVDGDVADSLEPEAQADLMSIMDNQHLISDLHAFVVVTRPRGHPDNPALSEAAAQMSAWWQVMRSGWCKGMPILRWGETDAGIRLFP